MRGKRSRLFLATKAKDKPHQEQDQIGMMMLSLAVDVFILRHSGRLLEVSW